MTQPKANLADYFSSHLVTMIYRHEERDRHGKPVKGTITVGNGSGFLMVYRDVWFLLTAGHVIEEIERLFSLPVGHASVHLVDGLGYEARYHHQYPLPYEALRRTPVGDADRIDYGLIILNDLTIEALKANNLKPVTPENWRNPPEEFEEYFLVGTPQELVGLNSRSAVADVEKVGAVLLPVTPINTPPEHMATPFPRFYGRINLPSGDSTHPPLTTILGMSGGPIFGMNKIGERYVYWFYAMQSGWDESSRTIAACPFKPFADHIAACLDDVLDTSTK